MTLVESLSALLLLLFFAVPADCAVFAVALLLEWLACPILMTVSDKFVVAAGTVVFAVAVAVVAVAVAE